MSSYHANLVTNYPAAQQAIETHPGIAPSDMTLCVFSAGLSEAINHTASLHALAVQMALPCAGKLETIGRLLDQVSEEVQPVLTACAERIQAATGDCDDATTDGGANAAPPQA